LVTPNGQNIHPQKIEDLLLDPRFIQAKRHLRRIYPDPISGKKEWGIIKANNGSGIIGIHSTSNTQPIKTDNFNLEFKHFTGRNSYSDWVFSIENQN
jgi:hypothetical protein